jgi:lysozyme family protein
MKENFDLSLEKVLQYEGGFSNHPKDRGGPTNQGITLSTMRDFYSEYDYGDLDGDGDIDIDDVLLLDTPEEAAPIYKKYYWDKMMLDDCPAGIDFLLFDFGVNSGPRNAVKILQKALNRQGAMVDIDGVLGMVTFGAVAMADMEQLIPDMLKERDIFYRKIVASNPEQEVFLKGWMNRLADVRLSVQEFV